MPLFHPELFQGVRRRRRYFEGWYFKQVSPDGRAWSFIPGVSLDAAGRRTAFVQAIDGGSGGTRWYPFPFESFRWDRRSLDIRVGDNRFSLSGIDLDLDGPDGRVRGELRYGPAARFPSRPWLPGVMGPYSFVPFMECNHGLVSLDHRVDGRVEVDGLEVSMDGGRGYIEKDWGSSMPAAWIWSQSNSFPEPGISFMFSLADIPWMGGRFPGFLCAALLPSGYTGTEPASAQDPSVAPGRVRVWASWNGSRIDRLEVGDRYIGVRISRRAETLELRMERGRGGLLRAPAAGAMDRRIAESVDAVLSARLEDRGRRIFEGTARPAGLEVVGDLSLLHPGRSRGRAVRGERA